MVGTEITETGGVVTSEDGLLTLAFPTGAVSEPTFITVDPIVDATPFEDQVSEVYDLGPDGQTFDVPVTLSFQMDAIAADEELYVANLDGATPVEVEGSSWDPETGTVTAPLTHFSRYGIFVRALRCIVDCLDAGGERDWCVPCCLEPTATGRPLDCSDPPVDPVRACIEACISAGGDERTCTARCSGPGGGGRP
ncbi:MAG: hypothetical protein AAGH15_15305 [Myxococcota bacterium]